MTTKRTIYLAGPEVFLPDAKTMLDTKRRLARSFGFEPTGPGSDEGELPAGGQTAAAILKRNEDAMHGADICLANITPFRGISADVGTVYEVGFMLALAKTVWAYTNEARDYGTRVRTDWYAGKVITESAPPRGPDGLMIETHGKSDNLMIDAGIEARGGRVLRGTSTDPWDLAVYEQCLSLLSSAFDKR